MIGRLLRAAAVLGLVLVSVACDSGPHGPGELTGTVSAGALGGVLLEVTGPGIRGFEGLGSTQVYAATPSTPPNTHRVLLISPDGSDLRFEMRVLDVGAHGFQMHVLSATGTDNRPRQAGDVQLRLERP